MSPAPVSTANTSNLPATKPRTESAEVSRGITISRSMERSKSAHSAHSPSPSPGSSPKSIHIYRADSVNSMKAGVAKTPSAKGGLSKGTEITRPRIPSRSASAHEDVSDSAKATKPVTIPMGPKGSYKPHKLKLKLAGHMVCGYVCLCWPCPIIALIELDRTAFDRLPFTPQSQSSYLEAKTALFEFGIWPVSRMARRRNGTCILASYYLAKKNNLLTGLFPLHAG